MTKIRFGVWRKIGKKREWKNDVIEVPGNFDDVDFTHKACKVILARYPGWMIHGFCEFSESERNVETSQS